MDEDIFQKLADALNQVAEDVQRERIAPLQKQINVLKMEKLLLIEENEKLKNVIEVVTQKPVKTYLDHLDAERYRNELRKKEREINALKNEIRKLKNPEISRYSISVKNKKGK